jgi:hypothetical protein
MEPQGSSYSTQNVLFYKLITLQNIIFWDITPCSPLKLNRRFGGIYRPHLQGRRISRARNQRERRWQGEPQSRASFVWVDL